MSQDEFAEVNECLMAFDMTMYRGNDGRCRVWGDINRIQDVIFSDCLASFPQGARADLDWFFAHEVDALVARHLRGLGVAVDFAPSEEAGLGFSGVEPSDEELSSAFQRTYDWFRDPPDRRGPAG